MEMLNREYIKRTTGYEVFTTFYEDFSIAEQFGENAIKETYDMALKNWGKDYKYVCELILVTNWKSWHKADRNEKLSRLYADLYYKVRDYFFDHFDKNKEAIEYYYRYVD